MAESSFGVIIIATSIRPFVQDPTGFMQSVLCRNCERACAGAERLWPTTVHGTLAGMTLLRLAQISLTKTIHEEGGSSTVHIKMICIIADLLGLQSWTECLVYQ